MIEKNIEIGMLFDFYGELLTKKQKGIMDLHFCEDFSFAEIAQELSITKQAVNDSIKTSEILLREYEEKLGHMDRFSQISDLLIKIKDNLEVPAKIKENIEKIEGIL